MKQFSRFTVAIVCLAFGQHLIAQSNTTQDVEQDVHTQALSRGIEIHDEILLEAIVDFAEISKHGKVKKGSRFISRMSKKQSHFVYSHGLKKEGWVNRSDVKIVPPSGKQSKATEELEAIIQKLELQDRTISADSELQKMLHAESIRILENTELNHPVFRKPIEKLFGYQNESTEIQLRRLKILERLASNLFKYYFPESYEHPYRSISLQLHDVDLFTADQCCDRYLTLTERLFGVRHALHRVFLAQKANSLGKLSKNRQAVDFAVRALESAESEYGQDDTRCNQYRTHLARLSNKLGQLERATSLLEFNIETESPKTAINTRNEIASLYRAAKKFNEERRIRQQNAIAAAELFGNGSLEHLQTQHQLLTTLVEKSNTKPDALLLINQLLEEAKKLPKEQALERLEILNDFRFGLYALGQDSRADNLSDEIIQGIQKLPASEQRDQQWYLATVGLTNDVKRFSHLQSYIDYCNKTNTSNFLPSSVNDLASCYAVLADKGDMLVSKNEAVNACELAYRLNISRTHSVSLQQVANSFERLGEFNRAEEILKIQVAHEEDGQTYHHPDASVNLLELAKYYFRNEKWLNGLDAFDRVRKQLNRYMTKQLPSFTAERRNTFLHGDGDYYGSEFREGINFSFSFALLQNENTDAINRSAEWILNSKSLAESILASIYQSENGEASRVKQELSSIRAKIAAASILGRESDPEFGRNSRTAKDLEFELAGVLPINEFEKPWVELSQVRDRLEPNSILLEVSKFRMLDLSTYAKGFANDKNQAGHWRGDCYAVWIIPDKSEGEIVCVDLGSAKDIEAAVLNIKEQLSVTPTRLAQGQSELEQELKQSIESLSNLILRPLQPHLKNVNKLIISPDGELWAIPWEILSTDSGQYLVEEFQVRYVSSGRELAESHIATMPLSQPVIFADPDYNLNFKSLGKSKELTGPNFSRSNAKTFHRIPFSAAEANSIRPSIETYLGMEATLYTGNRSTESAFKQLNNPRLLVLSTHGYFEQDAKIKNPLLRCGLALAGCNKSQHAFLSNREDGILTGLEIVNANLKGTELVVLSACETGVGEIATGEGVAGLRQAFQLAGAESVLASLWQVDDAETARLMNLFFENLANGKSKSESLRQAQLTRIAARRERHGAAHPFFWAAFTLTGRD